MQVENEKAREWYINEAADQNWGTRQLDRQVSVFYYERILGSRDKESVKQEADEKMASLEPTNFIRVSGHRANGWLCPYIRRESQEGRRQPDKMPILTKYAIVPTLVCYF
jgi:hypothetical protein